MSRFIRAFKAGVAAFREGTKPGEYVIGGTSLRCPHCGSSAFSQGRAMLNSAGSTLLNLDWLDPSATILVCSGCSRIEWFAREPERQAG